MAVTHRDLVELCDEEARVMIEEDGETKPRLEEDGEEGEG
jgi:hypothetical protein